MQEYGHTLTVFNIYLFPTTITVTRTRLSITFYVSCLSFRYGIFSRHLSLITTELITLETLAESFVNFRVKYSFFFHIVHIGLFQ